MHNNYYFLKHLTNALTERLIGATLSSCFSQNKNELIIILDRLIIKAYLAPSFCCLSFPDDFHRARKNSINLFEVLIDQKIDGITQYLNERCFTLDFNTGHQLLFKLHGNRSNVILMNHGEVEELFVNKLAKDHELSIEKLDRPIDQSVAAFETADGEYKKLFPTFGKVVQQNLTNSGYANKSETERWELIQNVLTALDKKEFFIEESPKDQIQLSLLKSEQCIKSTSDPIEALNFFFNKYISQTTLANEKHQITQKLSQEIKRLKNYIAKSENKLQKLESGVKYNHLADILMANLHQLQTGLSNVTLPNFYQNNESIDIKLKRDASPQQNAENYYKKSKNQGLEINILKENIDNKVMQLMRHEDQWKIIEDIESLKELRKYIKSEGLENTSHQDKHLSRPYFKFEYMGFDILVGKSAKANDELLRNYSYKEDLWLHVKDVSGSHVLIKHQSGKEFALPIVERAAELAAYYSKRKNDTLCPVIYTPRKYVRKRKNDPPGAVVVEREQVLLVEPKK